MPGRACPHRLRERLAGDGDGPLSRVSSSASLIWRSRATSPPSWRGRRPVDPALDLSGRARDGPRPRRQPDRLRPGAQAAAGPALRARLPFRQVEDRGVGRIPPARPAPAWLRAPPGRSDRRSRCFRGSRCPGEGPLEAAGGPERMTATPAPIRSIRAERGLEPLDRDRARRGPGLGGDGAVGRQRQTARRSPAIT